jgi:hypothetical protein
MNPVNPFAALGLPDWPDLDDETVDAAWAAIAAETHLGRPDGGNLARYTQAAAAYAELNSRWGRSEAFADLLEQAWAEGRYDAYPGHYPPGWEPDDEPELPANPWQLPPPMWLADPKGMVLNLPWRFRHGHPAGLPVLAAFIAGVCLGVLAVFPHLPPSAVAASGIVWFVLAGREALAPPPGQ